MAEVKPKVTLIGIELAKNGLEFIYEGTISECSPCKLNKACNNLKKGRRYRIVGVRPAEHSCVVHLNGTRAVEVIESPIPALLSADMAIRNTKIQFECSCTKEQCPNYLFCRPDGIIEREKYIVVTGIGSAPERWLVARASERLGQPDSAAAFYRRMLGPGLPTLAHIGLVHPFVHQRLVMICALAEREELREAAPPPIAKPGT